MMLNAHRDTDINDNEKVQSYEEDPDKWKKRGNCPGHSNVEDGNEGGSTPTPQPILKNLAFSDFFSGCHPLF